MNQPLVNKKWVCRKLPYESGAKAKTVLKKLKKRKGRGEQRAYYCDVCDAWHLTKSKKKFTNVNK